MIIYFLLYISENGVFINKNDGCVSEPYAWELSQNLNKLVKYLEKNKN